MIKTYRTLKFGNCARKSGTDPVKLLSDKSLIRHAHYYDQIYRIILVTSFTSIISELGTYKDWIIESFDMFAAILPVNPLEDKFLIVITLKMHQNYQYLIKG